MIFGSPLVRTIFEKWNMLSLAPSGLQHDLDTAIPLVAKHLVHLWPLLQRGRMSDHERRIDLAVLDATEQIVGPAVDVSLSRAHREPLVHEGAHRELVREAAIDSGDGDDAACAADIDHLAQHV